MLLPLHWMSIHGRNNKIRAASEVTRLIFCNTSGMPAAGLGSMPGLQELPDDFEAPHEYQSMASSVSFSFRVWESFISVGRMGDFEQLPAWQDRLAFLWSQFEFKCESRFQRASTFQSAQKPNSLSGSSLKLAPMDFSGTTIMACLSF